MTSAYELISVSISSICSLCSFSSCCFKFTRHFKSSYLLLVITPVHLCLCTPMSVVRLYQFLTLTEDTKDLLRFFIIINNTTVNKYIGLLICMHQRLCYWTHRIYFMLIYLTDRWGVYTQ